MEYGYNNWSHDSHEDSNYMDYESPPQRRSSTSNIKSNKNAKSDEYEFEISQDDDFMDSPVIPTKKNSTYKAPERRNSVATSSTRRSSVTDRAKEILERNKAVGRNSGVEENTERLSSYKSTLADLMEGINVTEVVPKRTNSNAGIARQDPKQYVESPKSLNSPADSFDISASDLEVRHNNPINLNTCQTMFVSGGINGESSCDGEGV